MKEFMGDVGRWRWVSEGVHAREMRTVGSALFQIREGDPQEDLIFRCFVRGGWGAVPRNGGVLRYNLSEEKVKKTIRSSKGGDIIVCPSTFRSCWGW